MAADKEQTLELLIRAKYPLLYIISSEERRVEELLRSVAARRHKQLFSWTVTDGIADISTPKPVSVNGGVPAWGRCLPGGVYHIEATATAFFSTSDTAMWVQLDAAAPALTGGAQTQSQSVSRRFGEGDGQGQVVDGS